MDGKGTVEIPFLGTWESQRSRTKGILTTEKAPSTPHHPTFIISQGIFQEKERLTRPICRCRIFPRPPAHPPPASQPAYPTGKSEGPSRQLGCAISSPDVAGTLACGSRLCHHPGSMAFISPLSCTLATFLSPSQTSPTPATILLQQLWRTLSNRGSQAQLSHTSL
jgi:hypothetical protein